MRCSGSHSNPAQQGLPVMNLYVRTTVSKSIYATQAIAICASVRPSAMGTLASMKGKLSRAQTIKGERCRFGWKTTEREERPRTSPVKLDRRAF